jgi:hypothetical protein
MRRPIAATHLARIVHMTSAASLARAVVEGRLQIRSTGTEDDLVLAPLRELAREEKVIEEEARALAQTRGWPTNLAGTPYGWTRLGGELAREALPRIIRIYDREVFELDADLREHGDEEVRSLLAAALDGRRAVLRTLSLLSPQATLPGAK